MPCSLCLVYALSLLPRIRSGAPPGSSSSRTGADYRPSCSQGTTTGISRVPSRRRALGSVEADVLVNRALVPGPFLGSVQFVPGCDGCLVPVVRWCRSLILLLHSCFLLKYSNLVILQIIKFLLCFIDTFNCYRYIFPRLIF